MTECGGGVFQQEVDGISGEQQTAGELRLWRLVENHRQPQDLSHLLRLRLMWTRDAKKERNWAGINKKTSQELSPEHRLKNFPDVKSEPCCERTSWDRQKNKFGFFPAQKSSKKNRLKSSEWETLSKELTEGKRVNMICSDFSVSQLDSNSTCCRRLGLTGLVNQHKINYFANQFII